MIYFMKNNIVIRRMQDTDPQIFSNEECAQGWHASPQKYDMRISDEKRESLSHLQQNIRIILPAI